MKNATLFHALFPFPFNTGFYFNDDGLSRPFPIVPTGLQETEFFALVQLAVVLLYFISNNKSHIDSNAGPLLSTILVRHINSQLLFPFSFCNIGCYFAILFYIPERTHAILATRGRHCPSFLYPDLWVTSPNWNLFPLIEMLQLHEDV